ncbi:MAG: hypothetical protein ACXV5J_12495, partial [Candidatus Angelobacter sp.]
MNLVLSKRKVLAGACLLAGLLAFLSVAAGAQILAPSHPPDWAQWGLNAQHSLFDGGVTGQPLNRNIVNLVYDFNIDAEKADPNATGDLLVHYQVPLVDGNDVFIESKDGTYSNDS